MLPPSNHRGFTLIEMLISIAIIGILSVVVFGNFVNQNRQQAVRSAANQLSLELQKMYTYAQAGRPQNDIVPAGYGLHINAGATGYAVLADAETSPNSGIGNGYFDIAELIESKTFPANVNVASITEAGQPATTVVDLVYTIPGAGLKAKQGNAHTAVSQQITIKLQHTALVNTTSCVTVTPAVGAVNVITCP